MGVSGVEGEDLVREAAHASDETALSLDTERGLLTRRSAHCSQMSG